MSAARLAPWIVLAGCGRIGFVDAPADAAPDEQITLIVTSDEYGSDVRGAPIVGAAVIVEHAGGPAVQLATDATGAVTFPAAGVTASHVAFKSELGWRVYTVAVAHPGTVELGGRASRVATHQLSLTLPDNGATSYAVRIPEHCAAIGDFTSPIVTLEYAAPCEGEAVHALVFSGATAVAARPLYLDARTITLRAGAATMLAGTYADTEPHQITLTQLPGAASTVTAALLARDGLALTPLAASPAMQVPQAGAAVLDLAAAPGATMLSVSAYAALGAQLTSSSALVVPVSPGAPAGGTRTLRVDAGRVIPPFTNLRPTGPALAWTGGGAGGTILTVQANAGAVQWDAYLEPTATTATFPSLPGELGVPAPTRYDFAAVHKLEVPGATATDLLRTLDRTWNDWPHDAALLPAEGSAHATILYAATQSPITAGSEAAGSPPARPDRARAAAAGSPARARPGGRGTE